VHSSAFISGFKEPTSKGKGKERRVGRGEEGRKGTEGK